MSVSVEDDLIVPPRWKRRLFLLINSVCLGLGILFVLRAHRYVPEIDDNNCTWTTRSCDWNGLTQENCHDEIHYGNPFYEDVTNMCYVYSGFLLFVGLFPWRYAWPLCTGLLGLFHFAAGILVMCWAFDPSSDTYKTCPGDKHNAFGMLAHYRPAVFIANFMVVLPWLVILSALGLIVSGLVLFGVGWVICMTGFVIYDLYVYLSKNSWILVIPCTYCYDELVGRYDKAETEDTTFLDKGVPGESVV